MAARSPHCGCGKSEGSGPGIDLGTAKSKRIMRQSPEFQEETAMLRFVVALGLCCMAVATTASYQSAKAVNDQSLCFDTWTTLDAGGPVSDEVLAAAQNACARLQQSPQDRKTLEKINKAVEVIAGEVQRRQAAPH